MSMGEKNYTLIFYLFALSVSFKLVKGKCPLHKYFSLHNGSFLLLMQERIGPTSNARLPRMMLTALKARVRPDITASQASTSTGTSFLLSETYVIGSK